MIRLGPDPTRSVSFGTGGGHMHLRGFSQSLRGLIEPLFAFAAMNCFSLRDLDCPMRNFNRTWTLLKNARGAPSQALRQNLDANAH